MHYVTGFRSCCCLPLRDVRSMVGKWRWRSALLYCRLLVRVVVSSSPPEALEFLLVEGFQSSRRSPLSSSTISKARSMILSTAKGSMSPCGRRDCAVEELIVNPGSKPIGNAGTSRNWGSSDDWLDRSLLGVSSSSCLLVMILSLYLSAMKLVTCCFQKEKGNSSSNN